MRVLSVGGVVSVTEAAVTADLENEFLRNDACLFQLLLVIWTVVRVFSESTSGALLTLGIAEDLITLKHFLDFNLRGWLFYYR